MDFRILGPLEALDEGRTVALSGSKQRALLALLLLHPNETLSRDRLIDELWGEHPPDTATKTVQVHVSRLRKTLGAAAGNGANGLVVTRDHGYELTLAEEQLDARQFERLLAEGSEELRAGRPELAVPALKRALSLWRGPAFADLAYEPFVQREIARLEDLRIDALEQLIDAKLALGRHTEVIGQLETLIGEHPYRERLHAQLMLALYRSERQADALQAYQNARRTLVGELGIEPGERLRALEQGILNQDPQLELPVVEPVELPPELDISTLLAGRETELGWVQEHWSTARRGGGRLVLISGARGIGKTRLVAELAGEVQRDGGAVRYVSGNSGSDDAEEALAAAKAARRPTLLVFDDVDRAGERQVRALNGLAKKLAGLPMLVVATSVDSGLATRVRADATLDLGPLDDGGVLAVARLYAGARDDAEVPVDQLAEVSGGIPLRVHRAAGEWARVEASRRLGVAADRAQEERTGLRAAEDELAGNVVELQAVRERAELGDRERVVACPFKGLGLFDVEDAEVFFGRERLVAEMVARLAGAPLMGVVGPSGSGKSSALRAGLLAALSGGVLPGSEHWALALLRPGAHPLGALEQATAESPRQGRLVIAVDQFEEVFTACRDESERAAFVDALVACARDPRRRALVLVAVRADFYGRCAAYPELSRLLGANHVLVGPMQRDELRRAIELPARRAGLHVEPELVDALLADVEGEPGALPLLSASLLELWQRRDGRRLRMSAYQHAGGVHGAVARLAESAWERLEPERRDAARRILLRLAGEGEGEAVVRRRVPLAELEAERDEAVADVLAVLGSERLVTIGEGEVEVAHEALLREWPRLRGWLEEGAEGRRLHQHLIHAASEWQASGRDPGELYRGARLASTLDWAASHEGDLNELERAFLDESRAEAEHEAERQRQANRRLRVVLAGLAALLAVAVVTGVVALNQRGEARDAALAADAQLFSVDALKQPRLDRALLLTRAAVELEESPATWGSLLSVLLRAPAAIGVVNHGWPMYAAAVSPDGSLMATGDERGAVTVYDAATRRPLGRPYWIQGGLIQQLEFSPDGRRLAISSMDPEDPEHNAVADLIDPRTRERRLRVRLPALRERASFVVADVVFAPEGGDLLVRQVHGDAPDGPASPVYRVDGRTGAVTDRLLVGRYTSYFYASETADRERFFLTSQRDNRTWELDPEPLRVVRSWPVADSAGAVSPDGRIFALGSQAGRVRLLNLASGEIRTLRGRHDGPVLRMRFTPDGRTLVSSGQQGQLSAWDVERGSLSQRFAGHTGDIDGLDLTRDGRTLITASVDTRAILWDLAGDRRLDRRFTVRRPFEVFQTPRGIAVSPDGRTLALTHSDGAVDLIDTRSLRRRASVRAIDGIALSVDFSPDGRLLAVTGEGGHLTLWNARTLAPAGELKGMHGLSQALAFSPDGKLVAAAEADVRQRRPLRVWDVRRRTLTAFRGRTAANLVAFSPDGELIAGAATERGTDVRDVRTGRLVKRLGIGNLAGQGDFSRSVTFSPDGDLLFVGQYNGTGRLFSTETWKQVGRSLAAQTARITFPEFSPDGRTLVTASADGTVVLWDVETQKPIGSPLALEPNTWVSAALSPDGSRLYAISTQGEGISFNMSPEAWKRHACLVAGRELTADEWDEALPDRPYQSVCSGD
jgi:WD40 repeat protein/DNA-binding SARP family transcriptional activator